MLFSCFSRTVRKQPDQVSMPLIEKPLAPVIPACVIALIASIEARENVVYLGKTQQQLPRSLFHFGSECGLGAKPC